MTPVHRHHALSELQRWYQTPLGLAVARLENACVRRLLASTFGYYLVHVGALLPSEAVLTASRIRQQVLVTPLLNAAASGLTIIGMETALPVAADSVDAVLLAHTLELSADPRQAVAEVERVLIPDGRLIVIGFNALSVWELWRWLPGTRQQLPQRGQLRTAAQVESWLQAAGFALEAREYLWLCPPLGGIDSDSCAPLETLGQRFWPFLGGIYVIRAVKRVAIVTPLRPAWSRRCPMLTGAAVRPTTRDNGHV
jgi:SAM-dependent methyltransferase